MKILFALIILFSLTACSPPLASGEMLPMTQIYSQLPQNRQLERSITLGKITVFDNAGGMVAPVTSETYQETLQSALLTAGMAARTGDKPKYILDAELLELDQPIVGFNLTVDSKAHYVLREINTGKIILNETVTIPYTANFSEAFDGTQRMRIATARSVRENITHMIRVLAAKSDNNLIDKRV